MSDLTPCNFNTYMRMREKAEARNVKVVLDMVDFGPIDGTPTNWWITATYSDEQEPSAMFKALTTECAC
jgi:hypothetical protein